MPRTIDVAKGHVGEHVLIFFGNDDDMLIVRLDGRPRILLELHLSSTAATACSHAFLS